MKNKLHLKKSTQKKQVGGIWKILAITLVTMVYSSAVGALIDKNRSSITVNAMEYVVRSEDNLDALTKQTSESFDILPDELTQMFVLRDSELLQNTSIPSATVAHLEKRELVYVMYIKDEFAYVTTTDNLVGYVKADVLTDDVNQIFDAYETQLYANEGARLLSAPAEYADVVAYPEEDEVINITGNNDGEYFMADFNGENVYIHQDDVSARSSTSSSGAVLGNPSWDGSVLSPSAGVVMGPSGKETYYNLNMSGVISILQGMGINEEYWVREDGVKMYGDYIIAACAFDIRPRGSYVETSLGTAICADTGTFAYDNPTQIDIAVDW